MFTLTGNSLTFALLNKRAGQLKKGWQRSGGRNTLGRITSYKKGPYKYKRLYRFVDFWRRLKADAFIINIEKDNFRSSTLTLVFYQTGYLSYVVLPDGYDIGDKLQFSLSSEIYKEDALFIGNALPLSKVLEVRFCLILSYGLLKGRRSVARLVHMPF